MDIFNPHNQEPVESGQFCWRVNQSRSWDSGLYKTESEAIEAAKAHCLKQVGVGRHTIHIGVTKTEPVNNQVLIKRYQQHLAWSGEIRDVLSAMGLPLSLQKATQSEIASGIGETLSRATLSCKRTEIVKQGHRFFCVDMEDVGIKALSIAELLAELRSYYSASKPEWNMVKHVQKALIMQTEAIIKKKNLPFKIQPLCLWQGFDRTKTRLHIVCSDRFSDKRFHREKDAPLCIKTPKIETPDDSCPAPCLTCFERLSKIIS